jgi:hypothetical protein
MAGRPNSMVAYAAVGLEIGAIGGYLTRPDSTEIKIGPVQIEVTGKGVARGGGDLTSSQVQHVLLITLLGGLIGVGFGYAVDRGKFRA